MALDYGTRRTGVAVSDPLRIIAGGLETVLTHRLYEWLDGYLSTESVDVIVVGLPTGTDGQPSRTAPGADILARTLQKRYPALRVVRYDERFTSVLAHRAMLEGGMKKMQRRDKGAADRISATIILQDYMNSLSYRSDNEKDTVK